MASIDPVFRGNLVVGLVLTKVGHQSRSAKYKAQQGDKVFVYLLNSSTLLKLP